MPRPKPKFYMPFTDWPAADKLLWQQASDESDPFISGDLSHLKAASKEMYFEAWRRFLGFLAITEPEALALSPAARLSAERMRRFVAHLAETCSAASVLIRFQTTYNAARLLMPNLDLRWMLAMMSRLRATNPPKPEKRPVITSVRLLELGQKVMDQAKCTMSNRSCRADDIQFRDGVLIAFTAFIPIRLKNLTALDIDKHFRFSGDKIALRISRDETKTSTAINFDVPEVLKGYFEEYCTIIRPRLNFRGNCTALWVNSNGRRLSEAGIQLVFKRHSSRNIGVHLSPHDVRAAAATTWAIFAPEDVGVAQDLLLHKDRRTTNDYYNFADGIIASRDQSKIIRDIKSARRCGSSKLRIKRRKAHYRR